MIHRHIAALLLALALPFALIASPALADEHHSARASDAVWPFAQSDLAPDPQYRFGVLDNGLRYIIRPNATPPEQGMVQFWVDFGSVAEGEGQQGWAHYIEHMAFNGSTNLPEGEMIKLLEREGLAFGADTNASTGFDQTIYKLDLPRNDPALLDTALMLMRETASELTFAEDAVERERGIILSERRVRDTFQMRALVDNFGFLYPGSRLAERFPIGTIETIQNATGSGMKELWAQYYRPENAAIIVVGDYDADAVERAIAEHFGDWEGEPRLEHPGFGPLDPDYAGATAIYLDPALSEHVAVSRHGPYRDEPDTAATRQENILRGVGYGIINRRMQSLARLGDPPFRGAGIGTSNVFEEGRTTSLTVAAAEGEWERGLAAAQEEYRRALEFGFSEAEVAEQVANLANAIEVSASGAATRPNGAYVQEALALLGTDQIPTTPASSLERFNAFRTEITPAAVLEALRRDIVPLENPLIRFSGRTAPEGGEEALRAAWTQGMGREMAAREETEQVDFAYTDFGPPGTITSWLRSEDLGISQLTFANGLKLNLKPTELQQDRISLELNIDGGSLLDTRDDPLATAMVSSLVVGGLGAHDLDQLQSILAGKQLSLDVAAAPETFRLAATTTRRDLEMQLQLFTAAISDPGYRPEGEVQYRRNIANFYASRFATPESTLSVSLGAIRSDNDPRHSLQDEEDYLALSFARLREAIEDRFDNGAMELALVGDFEEAEVIAMVARTLGTLPQREQAFRDYADNRERSFTADRSLRVLYHDGADDQAIVNMSWPTRDDSDQRASQVLSLLGAVMRLQVLDILREELGQTYSPTVGANQSRVHPGYGIFAMQSAVDVGDVEATREAMLRALETVRAAPPSADLMLRARQPLLERYDNALDTNAGWMSLVDRAQSQPDRIQRFLTGKTQLQAITAEQLQQAARLYLVPEERLEVLVLPRAQEAAQLGATAD